MSRRAPGDLDLGEVSCDAGVHHQGPPEPTAAATWRPRGHRPEEVVIATDAARRTNWPQFARHFAEMVVAMVLGMMILGMAVRLVLAQVGQTSLLDPTEVAVLVMSTNMTIGMTLLMRLRGHGWASVAEMAGAMYVPFLVLLIPFWLGALSGPAVMVAGHVLMIPFMLLVMLRRRDEYAHDHRPRQQTPAQR